MRHRHSASFVFGAVCMPLVVAAWLGPSAGPLPVSAVSEDLNQDGRADLIVGYVDGVAGSLAIRWRAAEAGSSDPFAPEIVRLVVPEIPDFLQVGDFDADGQQDILVAADRASALLLLRGDGRGGFEPGRRIALPGRLTALVAGEVNRPDGVADVVAAVGSDHGATLFVFQNHRGAFSAEPESIELDAAVSGIALARFDDDIFVDIAAGTGHELRLVHGRDRMTSVPGPESNVRAIEVDRITGDDAVRLLAASPLVEQRKAGVALRMRLGTSALPELVIPSKDAGTFAIVRAPSAATFVVNTTGDGTDALPGNGVCADSGGQCSLRAAIGEANALAGADTITFGIGPSTPTIQPASALPAIVETVTIDGASGGATRVELSGASVGAGSNGLVVNASASAVAIRNLVINRFPAAGIRLEGANNVVEGCYIGTDATGGASVGGNARGVLVTGASATTNTIGGTTAAQRNVISHNTGEGVRAESSAAGTLIRGNYVGTDPGGTAANGNGSGIALNAVTSTLVGGAVSVAGLPPGNLISGNLGSGVALGGASATNGNLIQGNLIGTNAAGDDSIPNGGSAIACTASGANTTIGGSTVSLRNVIAGSITFTQGGPAGSLIQGNFLGTDITGMSTLPGGPVSITNGAGSLTIGGNTATAGTPPGNVLRLGVTIQGGSLGPSSATVRGNVIGLRADGHAALAGATGVNVSGGTGGGGGATATVGGSLPGDRNVISGTTGVGLTIFNANATVQGNFIGLDIDGIKAIGNSGDGISVSTSQPGPNQATLTIGGPAPAARNVIAGNGGNGITLARNVGGSVIEGNYIGVLADLTTLEGNLGHGILADQIGGTLRIGGTTGLTPGGCTGSCNVIAVNAGDGISVTNFLGGAVTVRGNSMFGNGGLGIDHDNNGVTENDPGDVDLRQNFPLVTSAVFDGVNTTIQGTLDSTAGATFNIDVFANTERDAPGFAEGRAWLGSTTCVTNGAGNCSWTVVAAGPSSLHTATATAPTGRTSELTKNQDPNDLDGDGIPNATDDCPNVYDPQQADFDGDGRGDLCDNCRFVANTNQSDADADGQGDVCDPCPTEPLNDQDGDGVCGNVDNCPTTWNHAQADRDSDGRGDLCDNCPAVSNSGWTDSDNDGAGDACDCEPADHSDSLPAPPAGLTAAKSGTAGISLSWSGISFGSERTSITRGLLSAKGAGQYGSCLVEGIRFGGPYTDPTVPPPGDGYFYLLQSQNFDCGMGSLGFTSSEADRVNNDPNACHGYPFNDAYATSETTVIGTVTGGSYLDTHSSNDVVESIREGFVGPDSRLDHRWTFSVVPGAFTEIHIETDYPISSDSDEFRFGYSTDGVNFTALPLISFPASDNDIDQVSVVGGGLSGNVIIRVIDTQSSGGTLDTIHVDELWIRTIP